MTTNRKTCPKCKKRKMYSQYYKRSKGSSNGRWGECKECSKERQKNYRYGKCERCGKKHNQQSGHSLCRECRKPKPIEISKLSNGALCYRAKPCRFLAECKEQVMRKDWNWNPPCFVSSDGHEAYVAEYGRRQE